MSTRPKAPHTTEDGHKIEPGIHRVQHAVDLLLAGGRYSTVCAALVKTFEISKSQADTDLTAAKRVIAEEFRARLPVIVPAALEDLLAIITEAKADRDWKAAIAGWNQVIKMCGLEAPTRVAVTTFSPEQLALMQAVTMTPHERRQRMEQLTSESEPEPESN